MQSSVCRIKVDLNYEYPQEGVPYSHAVDFVENSQKAMTVEAFGKYFSVHSLVHRLVGGRWKRRVVSGPSFYFSFACFVDCELCVNADWDYRRTSHFFQMSHWKREHPSFFHLFPIVLP